MLSPKQLQTFRQVALHGSINGAATALFVSNAAVSSSVSELEREVGVELIERDGRGIRLTKPGIAMASYANRILGLMDEAVAEARAALPDSRTSLRIGAVTTAGEELVPRWLSRFLDLQPEVEVRFEVSNRDTVFAMLKDHEVDLAVSGHPPSGSGFATIAVREHELILVCAPALIVGGEAPDISEARWIVREEGSGTRSNSDELMRRLGVAPTTMTIDSNRAVVRAAEMGLGVALLSSDAIAREMSEGRLVRVDPATSPLLRRWHVLRRDDDQLSRGAHDFAAFLLSSGAVHLEP